MNYPGGNRAGQIKIGCETATGGALHCIVSTSGVLNYPIFEFLTYSRVQSANGRYGTKLNILLQNFCCNITALQLLMLDASEIKSVGVLWDCESAIRKISSCQLATTIT